MKSVHSYLVPDRISLRFRNMFYFSYRYLWAASSHEVGSDILIPETVTDLVEKGKQHNYVQIIQDLYQILKKLSAENKSLKQSVIDQKEIIEIEVSWYFSLFKN